MRSVYLAITLAAAGFGQTPSFDVASVKVSTGGGDVMRHDFNGRDKIQISPDGLISHGLSMRSYVAWAYHVLDYQVTGPDWIGGARYEISAKAGSQATEDQLRLMMQSLLAERFKLEVHRQTKEMQAYLLQVAKGGPKFKESGSDGDADIKPDQRTMTITAQRTSVPFLIDALVNIFRAPVIDQTGLTGKYDVTINVAKYIADFRPPGTGEAPPDPYAIIMRGLQEELGLKLEPKKMAVDLVVIDHIEKTPIAN